MAHSVKCLLCKHEDLSLDFQHPQKNWHNMPVILALGRGDRRIPGTCWFTNLVKSETCLKNKEESSSWEAMRKISHVNLWLQHAEAHTCITLTCTHTTHTHTSLLYSQFKENILRKQLFVYQVIIPKQTRRISPRVSADWVQSHKWRGSNNFHSDCRNCGISVMWFLFHLDTVLCSLIKWSQLLSFFYVCAAFYKWGNWGSENLS